MKKQHQKKHVFFLLVGWFFGQIFFPYRFLYVELLDFEENFL